MKIMCIALAAFAVAIGLCLFADEADARAGATKAFIDATAAVATARR